MMFQRGLFFLPLVCFAVGMQVPTPEVKYAAGSNDGPLTPANECDFYSCNDLVYELAARNGQRVQLGQCSSPAGGADNYFCYVNEDSSCEKKQTDLGWVSFEPCKAGNAVGTRAAPSTNVLDDEFVVVEEASPNANIESCDFNACNGLLIDVVDPESENGTTIRLGECLSTVFDEEFCFVNEDSPCPKKKGKLEGSYLAFEPCKDPARPNNRFFGVLTVSASKAACGFFGYECSFLDDYGNYVGGAIDLIWSFG